MWGNLDNRLLIDFYPYLSTKKFQLQFLLVSAWHLVYNRATKGLIINNNQKIYGKHG